MGAYESVAGYLAEVEASGRNSGLLVSSTWAPGDPASQILNEADKEPDTLVVMATHGNTGLGQYLLGEVTEQLLKKVTTPLMLVPSRPERDFAPDVELNSIVVPLVQFSLAEQVLPHIVALARSLDLSVILVTVNPPAGNFATAAQTPAERVDANATKYLEEVGDQLRILGVTRVVHKLLHGQPADAILELVQGASDYLVALATLDPFPAQNIVGRVTREVVSHSDSPVLIIRAR